MEKSFILASASPRRLELLKQVGFAPNKIIPAEIDETPKKGELPTQYVKRMAIEKCLKVHRGESITLAADTIVVCGRRILGKPRDEVEARSYLKLLSGRRHRVCTTICVNGRSKTVVTQVSFKSLSVKEIDGYIASNEWKGKAGGYAIQGLAASFVPRINGSYSNVVGLPLTETIGMLTSF